jgi:WD40 repeat protein
LEIALENTYQTIHSKEINCIAVMSPDIMITGSKDKTIAINYVTSSEKSYFLEGHTD